MLDALVEYADYDKLLEENVLEELRGIADKLRTSAKEPAAAAELPIPAQGILSRPPPSLAPAASIPTPAPASSAAAAPAPAGSAAVTPAPADSAAATPAPAGSAAAASAPAASIPAPATLTPAPVVPRPAIGGPLGVPASPSSPPTRKLKELIVALRSWAYDCIRRVDLDGIWLFGSAVYRDGAYFEPERSDIDLIISPKREATPAERLELARSLVRHVVALERNIALPILTRDAAGTAIVSVNLVTPAELRAGLHKDRKSSFYANNKFLALHEDSEAAPLISRSESGDLSPLICDVIADVQKYRNRYLKVSANGRRDVATWSDRYDALPKEICRAAAQLRYVLEKRDDDSLTDLNVGLAYVSQLLYRERGDKLVERLHDLIITRQGGRGTPRPLEPDDVLLLWELLFQRAVRRLPAAPSTPTPCPKCGNPTQLGVEQDNHGFGFDVDYCPACGWSQPYE